MRLKTTLAGILIAAAFMSLTACSKPEKEIPAGIETINTENVSNTEETGTTLPKDTKAADGVDSEVNTDKKDAPSTAAKTKDDSAIMQEFEKLSSEKEDKISDVIQFIRENILGVSPEHASLMLSRLEELQQKNKAAMEENYLSDSIQQGFQKDYLAKAKINQPDEITDAKCKELVQETLGNGYKIEQAEGTFFPVINYSVYKEFNSYATPEIKDYFDLMAVESDQIFARDGALVIGWDEVLHRALALENYLNQYPYSPKAESMKELYLRYERNALFGLNNTPLFDYDTKHMNEDAMQVYEEALKENSDSKFLDKLEGFMKIVKDSKGKLTDEVENYRKLYYGVDIKK